MSKDKLKVCLSAAKDDKYAWSLYFFKIDRRNSNPYEAYKIRFRNNSYLPSYVKKLIDCMLTFYINKIDEVEDYDGFNTKISCDKLLIDNDLIKINWDSFEKSIAKSNEDTIKDDNNGYVLVGQPILNDVENKLKAITFIKLSNPIIKLETKKTVVFKNTDNNELDAITDNICRLYLTADSILIDKCLYNFNHSFEKLFNIEQTLHKVKNSAIQKIIDTKAISNNNDFLNYSRQYNSPRTFVSLNKERISLIEDCGKRSKISTMLNINLDSEGKFIINSFEQTKSLIKYLCYKRFQEADTNYILETNSVKKIS